MTFPDSTSNWPSYLTQVQLYCDYCDQAGDDTHEDEYDADKHAQELGWYQGVDINGTWYDHVCDRCMDVMASCEWCEKLFNHDDSCFCCDVALCSEYCREQHHASYWDDNPTLPACEECSYPNPKYKVFGNQPTTAASWQL